MGTKRTGNRRTYHRGSLLGKIQFEGQRTYQHMERAMVDKTDVLTLGESYKLSVYVKFVGDSYSNEQRFSLQLQYNDGAGDVYQNIKTATVYKGTWTLLEGQLTVPSHAKDVKIYVETNLKILRVRRT